MSFFADLTYEGSRSITGPYLAVLGASAFVVGVVSGLGELLGYGLRLVSGQLSESTQKFWPITLFGYAIQMASVPALALAQSWPAAAILIITERIGKATRNPPRDVMLSHVASEMGYGWGLPHAFWVYFAGAALVAAGFVDFPIMAFHFQQSDAIAKSWIPIFYSVAMAVSGASSLLFGRFFDRTGIKVLLPLTLISSAATPLAFLGGFKMALAGSALWGLGTGVHESIIPAAVARIVPAARRPSAYGLFTAGFGIFWFLGSAVLGALYTISIPALVAFSVGAQLAAIPFFLRIVLINPPR